MVAFSNVASMIGATNRGDYEIPEVLEKLKELNDGVVSRWHVKTLFHMIQWAEVTGYNGKLFFEMSSDLGFKAELWKDLEDEYHLDNFDKELISSVKALIQEEM